MILFAGDTPIKILTGKKTQTRRCWKVRRAKPGSFHWAQTNMRADSRFARLEILDVWEQNPIDISPEHIKAEGFETLDEFMRAYVSGFPDADHAVARGERKHYVIDFKMVEITKKGRLMLAKAGYFIATPAVGRMQDLDAMDGKQLFENVLLEEWTLEYVKGKIPHV